MISNCSLFNNICATYYFEPSWNPIPLVSTEVKIYNNDG